MSDQALTAQGALISIGSGSPVSYSAIGEIKSWSGPGGQASVIDVTDLDSTAKEKRAGLQDEGQLTFEINYLPTDTEHQALRTAKASGAVTPFKITYTDSGGTEHTFNAIVLGFVIAGGVDDVIRATITLEITGALTQS